MWWTCPLEIHAQEKDGAAEAVLCLLLCTVEMLAEQELQRDSSFNPLPLLE